MNSEQDDIRHRASECKLQARIALLEIERTGLSREIANPRTSTLRRVAAIERRELAFVEWENLADELTATRLSNRG